MLAAAVVVVIVMLKAETGAIDKHLLKSVNSRYLFVVVVVAGLPERRLGVNPMIRRLLRRCSDWIAFVLVVFLSQGSQEKM